MQFSNATDVGDNIAIKVRIELERMFKNTECYFHITKLLDEGLYNIYFNEHGCYGDYLIDDKLNLIAERISEDTYKWNHHKDKNTLSKWIDYLISCK